MSLLSRPSRALAVLAAGAVLLAACGSDSDEESSSAAETSTVTDNSDSSTASSVDSSSAPESSTPATNPDKPTVSSLPAVPVAELGITDIREGTGEAAVEGDTVVVDYVGVRSEDGTEFDNSYDAGRPFGVGPLGEASVIDGWNQGLVGVKVGGLRQLDIPSALAYGDQAQGEIIQAGDDLTFLVEVRAILPSTSADEEPEVEVEASAGSTELTFTDLTDGTGAEVVDGDSVAIHYIAYNGTDGSRIDSSWEVGSPLTFTLGVGEVLEGIEQGVLGMQVGGRRQVVIPASLAFGEAGNPDLGLDAGADLIMVFDLVATY